MAKRGEMEQEKISEIASNTYEYQRVRTSTVPVMPCPAEVAADWVV